MNSDPKKLAATCGAKTRSGHPCKLPPVPGRTRCRFHGGASLAGVASPTFKHGRYSQYMPKAMLVDYQAGLQDPDLLELTEQIALIDARVVGLLGKLQGKDSGRAWAQLSKLWKDFVRAMNEGDAVRVQSLRNEITAVVERGAGEWAQWEELGRQVDRLARLKKEERERRLAAKQVVRADAVLLAMISLVEAVTGSVRKYTDVQTARNIITEVSQAYELLTGERQAD